MNQISKGRSSFDDYFSINIDLDLDLVLGRASKTPVPKPFDTPSNITLNWKKFQRDWKKIMR